MLSQGAPPLALQARTTRKLNRAQLLALAPRTPRQAELRYLKLVRAYMARVEALVEEIVLPIADTRDRSAGGDIRQADDKLVIRGDADDFDDALARVNARLGALDLSTPLRGILQGVAKHADKEAERTLGIDLRGQSSVLDRATERFVGENVRLIRSVSFDQLDRMRGIISAHHAGQGDRITLRNKLMDTFDLSRARANLIARDQVLKANAQITQFRQQNAGVTEYRWVTANDERVRGRPGGKWPSSAGDHWVLHGQVFRWDEPPVVDPRTGRRAHPGNDFQCRCTAVPVVERLLRG